MRRSAGRPLLILLVVVPATLFGLFAAYRRFDPLPTRSFTIAAGIAGSSYDTCARRYANILARQGVTLEVRNTTTSVENVESLRRPSSGVQAALSTFGFTDSSDAEIIYSLGGVFDAPIFVFYRAPEPITLFAQFRGKRLSIGSPESALRAHILEVLRVAGVPDDSIRLVDLDNAEALDALMRGDIDVAVFAAQLDSGLVRQAMEAPGLRLMDIRQAEAIAKTVPGLKHIVLSRGLVSLSGDIPNLDVDMLRSEAACSSDAICTPRCSICCSKQCARSMAAQGHSTASENSRPSSPTICRCRRWRRPSTAPARRSGSSTPRSGSHRCSAASCSLSSRFSPSSHRSWEWPLTW